MRLSSITEIGLTSNYRPNIFYWVLFNDAVGNSLWNSFNCRLFLEIKPWENSWVEAKRMQNLLDYYLENGKFLVTSHLRHLFSIGLPFSNFHDSQESRRRRRLFSSLPLSLASWALRNWQGDYCRELTSAQS